MGLQSLNELLMLFPQEVITSALWIQRRSCKEIFEKHGRERKRDIFNMGSECIFNNVSIQISIHIYESRFITVAVKNKSEASII